MYYTSLEAMARKYERTERQYAFHPVDQAAHEAWRKEAAARLKEISGIDQCEAADLRPVKHSEVPMDGFVKEYWTIQTEPDIYMPFYLLRPGSPNGAAVIVPHGHGSGKEGTVSDFDNPGVAAMRQWFDKGCFAHDLARAGYTVACPDERGSGERREAGQQGDSPEAWTSNSHRELLQVAIGFGQSVIGLAVWDLMRLVDFLAEQPDIDETRIGCAGMSGGGQQTLWLAAVDERISAAVTSGYFYGMKESLVVLAANCPCNFVPNMWRTMDMGDMGAMIAPRPLFIESGEKDGLNGPSGLLNVYPQVETARSAFRLYGAQDRLQHSIHPGGHQWVGAGVIEFFDKWLLRK
ncbi:alpha/beta hydrolase family protein [Lachnotalea sp. AF33-28]|uniref:alpha/beta hydrolase family protein n=1 Tax=Lachnotalea sp. AF33-28 TaxID=2292046 RepID=UPI000E527881|nr:alpha/beta hydrolase family protein [Lachnotalea sp. AF33-28]RHP30258.1 hypothetical protein DWZ56_19325 [Lachnotalea sp. AF33-28]